MCDSPSHAYDGDDRFPARAALPPSPGVGGLLLGGERLEDTSRRGPAAAPAGRAVPGPARLARGT